MSEEQFDLPHSAPRHDIGLGPHTHEPVRRRYPDSPLVGVAAAVFNLSGQVLLVQRGRPPSAGEWALPGGLLELGETLVAGARREVREECGIEIDVGGIIGAFEPIRRDKDGQIEYHFVVIDFWAAHMSGDILPADDALAATWATLEELEPYGLTPETLRIVLNGYQAWVEQHGATGRGAASEPGVNHMDVQSSGLRS